MTIKIIIIKGKIIILKTYKTNDANYENNYDNY